MKHYGITMVELAQLSKLGLFDARVPRYTSYPTAPQFSGAVGASQHVSWIEAIPENAQISLYLHVPFCRRLCWFCACRTQGTSNMNTVEAYLDTLCQEIDLLAQHLPKGVSLSRLHWGGGTPTLLEADMIRKLADKLLNAAPMAEGGEFSVEIDPNEIDDARLDALVAGGMNRASIGVQDFDPEIQKVIGREQSYEITKEVADKLRDRGIDSLNTDILYGLPHQSSERIAESVQRLLSLNPDRVALYGYAHVPWMARRQSLIPSDALPTPEERLALFETARQLFLWDGYEEIGIDHFARPEDGLAKAAREGRLRRNFQGYTDDTSETLIGIGASSISRFSQGYTQNAAATGDYTAHIRESRFSTTRGHEFTREDRVRARIIEGLMCDFEIDLDTVLVRAGPDAAEVRAWAIKACDAFKGYLKLRKNTLIIEEKGRPLTRMIARAFDAYDLSKAGHSSAV